MTDNSIETLSPAEKLSHSITLFGKDSVKTRLSALSQSGRMPHTVIFSGVKGVGKSVCARFLAALLICENVSNNEPCGVCRQCRRVAARIHPDVITPEKSGKLGIYSRDTMRGICTDAYIKPNDTDSKIYIFTDFENTEPVSQNVLLKIIEDPPEGVHFLFTVRETGRILPTILSRAAVIDVPEAPENAVFEALRQTEVFTAEDCARAVKAFHGNIGECLGFLCNPEQAKLITDTQKLTDALVKNREYDFLAALAGAGESKERLRELIMLCCKVIRDAVVMGDLRISTENRDLLGCYTEGSLALSKRISRKRLLDIYDALQKCANNLDFNVNVGLTSASLCAEVFSHA
jgi:DNA polymerase-3 subunit delta'